MEMKELIKIAEEKAGSQIALAKMLGQFDSSIRQVKAGKKGLPDAVCIELADFLKIDRLAVIAASNLVTEKNEKRREIFEKCIKGLNRATAAGLILTTSIIMTPSDGEAAGVRNASHDNVYYVKSNRRKWIRRKADLFVDFFDRVRDVLRPKRFEY